MRQLLSFAAIAAALLTAQPAWAQAPGQAQTSAGPPPPCVPQGAVTFICDHQRPEDLLLTPDGKWMLVGWFSPIGGLHAINTNDRTSVALYPSDASRERPDAKLFPDCPGPPTAGDKAKFEVHGIALTPKRNGRALVYAVHHGERESVEVFELDTRGATPTATWIGCSIAPDATFRLNSVIGLPDGGFIVTNLIRRNGPPDSFTKMAAGVNSGELWEYHSGKPWVKLPGTESAGPNGVELSKDGKTIYIVAWGSQSFIRVSRGRRGEPKREEVSLGFRADNARFARDGMIYVAGQSEAASCGTVRLTVCNEGGTRVVKIDPATLKVTTVIDHPNSDVYGSGTAAIPVGKEIWVGSFQKNSIAVFPAK